jgi:hypothetical protein
MMKHFWKMLLLAGVLFLLGLGIFYAKHLLDTDFGKHPSTDVFDIFK